MKRHNPIRAKLATENRRHQKPPWRCQRTQEEFACCSTQQMLTDSAMSGLPASRTKDPAGTDSRKSVSRFGAGLKTNSSNYLTWFAAHED